jgi:hypothetical protein
MNTLQEMRKEKHILRKRNYLRLIEENKIFMEDKDNLNNEIRLNQLRNELLTIKFLLYEEEQWGIKHKDDYPEKDEYPRKRLKIRNSVRVV